MPPSGYKQNQSRFITSFLSSCFEALLKEADELSLSLEQALLREIQNIDFAIKENVYTETANNVMLLTRSFYLAMLEKVQSNSTITSPQLVLSDINKQILTIDIESLLEKNSKGSLKEERPVGNIVYESFVAK
jgi:hypothetical protein